jgi:hypothetical protein
MVYVLPEDDLKRKVEICCIENCTNKQMLIGWYIFVLLSIIVVLTAPFESTFKIHNGMHILKICTSVRNFKCPLRTV